MLGAGIEAIGAEVARSWGLDESVLAMIRRLPLATPVRSAGSDTEMLRAVASCANEAMDAMALPGPHGPGAGRPRASPSRPSLRGRAGA